jgi:small-conductance mechanosensitive channel
MICRIQHLTHGYSIISLRSGDLPLNVYDLWKDMRADTMELTRHALPRVLIVLVVAFVLIRLLRATTRRLDRFSQNITTGERVHQMYQLRTLAQVINSVGVAIIFFLAAMQILPLLGLDIKPLLASAGIAGLAIGFGAQTIVKDVINGFFILLEDQYHLGDVVQIAGVKGTVEDMTLRRTALRDGDGSLHFIPNSEIKVVSNLTRDWTQVSLHVAVDYSEQSDRVIKLLREAALEVRNDPRFADVIVSEPEVPGIERVSGHEVVYLMLVKTRPGQHFAVSRELRRVIKECFEKNNIKMAAPPRIAVFDQETNRQSDIA